MMNIAASFIHWKKPIVINGNDSVLELAPMISEKKIKTVLIITDQRLMLSGLLNSLIESMVSLEINFEIYDKTISNPTIENVEEAVQLYMSSGAEGLIAFGGGSAIDLAKAVGASVVNPTKHIFEMTGWFKVKKKLPPLFAVPTTSGTGSEATCRTVITDLVLHQTYSIMDLVLVPKYVILDPQLTINLPKDLTATTGMSALSHAIEAYIGKTKAKSVKVQSRKAVIMFFANLEEAYFSVTPNSRENLLMASFYTGLSFARMSLGNTHAIAYTFGEYYHIPHGLANAIILPHVLQYYGKKVEKKLAELADMVRLTRPEDNVTQKANKFIDTFLEMNQKMNIPKKITIPNKDYLEEMIDKAYDQANPLYPVPVIFSKEDLYNIYEKIIEMDRL